MSRGSMNFRTCPVRRYLRRRPSGTETRLGEARRTGAGVLVTPRSPSLVAAVESFKSQDMSKDNSSQKNPFRSRGGTTSTRATCLELFR